MKNFRDLKVWESRIIWFWLRMKPQQTFQGTRCLDWYHRSGRCASSIPANIAEGCGRRGNGEFHRFLQIAMGSANELEYHLLLSRDLKFLDAAAYQSLNDSVEEVKRMLASLARKVDAERSQSRG